MIPEPKLFHLYIILTKRVNFVTHWARFSRALHNTHETDCMLNGGRSLVSGDFVEVGVFFEVSTSVQHCRKLHLTFELEYIKRQYMYALCIIEGCLL